MLVVETAMLRQARKPGALAKNWLGKSFPLNKASETFGELHKSLPAKTLSKMHEVMTSTGRTGHSFISSQIAVDAA